MPQPLSFKPHDSALTQHSCHVRFDCRASRSGSRQTSANRCATRILANPATSRLGLDNKYALLSLPLPLLSAAFFVLVGNQLSLHAPITLLLHPTIEFGTQLADLAGIFRVIRQVV